MIEMETERLNIRNFVPDDWRDLQEISIRYAASEYAQYDQQWPTATKEVKGMVEWFSEGDRFLAVCLQAPPQVIGLIALNQDEKAEGRAYKLGYVFHPDYHGNGYATESCRAVIDHAFGQWVADRIVVNTAAANDPSCRLLCRLGMAETGRGVGSFRTRQDGTPIEFERVSYALSREQWKELSTWLY